VLCGSMELAYVNLISKIYYRSDFVQCGSMELASVNGKRSCPMWLYGIGICELKKKCEKKKDERMKKKCGKKKDESMIGRLMTRMHTVFSHGFHIILMISTLWSRFFFGLGLNFCIQCGLVI